MHYRVVLYPGFSPEKQEEPEYKVNTGLTDQELGSNVEPSKNLSQRHHVYNLGRQVRTRAPALYKQLSEPNTCGFGRMSAMNTDMSYEYFLPKIRCQFSWVSLFVAHWSLSQAPPSFPSLAVWKTGRGPGTFSHISDVTDRANYANVGDM